MRHREAHWASPRVKAHVFLCMLAYYVEWHMRQDLAPLLFDDDDKAAAEQRRTSVVAPAQRSASAQQTRGSFGERGNSATHGPGSMDFIAVDEPEMNREVAAALARIVRALRVQLRKEAA